jgi:polysaccharide export outer membrane protein
MKVQALFQAALLLAPMVVASGCAGPSAPLPAKADEDVELQYVIGIPDLLRVTVWKHPDLSVDVPVRRDGKISIPLLDDVQAAGLTPEQLKATITKKLSGYISRPNVTVIVVSPDSQVVTVVGGVTQSGPVPLRRSMGAVEAIAAAGGFSPWANKSNVRVIRVVDGERLSYRVDYRAYLAGKADSDILLEPGDVVVVPE